MYMRPSALIICDYVLGIDLAVKVECGHILVR